MIHLILTAALTLLFAPEFGGASVPNDGLSVRDTIAVEELPWQSIGRGAQAVSFRINLFNAPQTISVIRYPMRRFRTMVVNDPGALSDSTEALAVRHRAVAGINGSYFDMKQLTPVTYVKERRRVEGRTTAGEIFRTDGVMAVRGRNVSIFACDTTDYDARTKGYRDVIAAGPVLLKDGVPARDEWPNKSFYYKRHPRTFVGVTADKWVYLVVIDGRFPADAVGTTIPETVAVAQMFGLYDALNLDGGGSSTLWTRDGGVLSNPYDNRRYDHYGQRMVPNVVLIK
jgi:exopolysaccharide biosynthesis protein